ncbi:MAG: exodeoxyribonuclease I, partial [Pseudomonadales bacterium]|nr:exodeoxyribonuclease I [Pseudomonadales bacterium]
QFIAKIHQEFSLPGSCGVGYNSIRFDDEVTRNTLYRNFYDPYEREWRNGNSRWGIIDLVRAVHAFRPEGINWPKDEQGVTRFKLELLSEANGLSHDSAHDALSDVYATIELARLIKQKQPKLYDFAFSLRAKRTVQDLLIHSPAKPVLHISSKYPADQNCLAMVLPLMPHPVNKNGMLVYDLSESPDELLSLSAADIHRRIFTATSKLEEGESRIPIKTIHFNRSPIVAPLSVLREGDAERLGLNLDHCKANYARLSEAEGLTDKLTQVFSESSMPENFDPDLMIYSGGFFSDADKRLFTQIRRSSAEQIGKAFYSFSDPRLEEMLFRYRARNFPESLDVSEQERWLKHCRERLTNQGEEGYMTLVGYRLCIDELLADDGAQCGVASREILENLKQYGEKLENL